MPEAERLSEKHKESNTEKDFNRVSRGWGVYYDALYARAGLTNSRPAVSKPAIYIIRVKVPQETPGRCTGADRAKPVRLCGNGILDPWKAVPLGIKIRTSFKSSSRPTALPNLGKPRK